MLNGDIADFSQIFLYVLHWLKNSRKIMKSAIFCCSKLPKLSSKKRLWYTCLRHGHKYEKCEEVTPKISSKSRKRWEQLSECCHKV